MIERNRGKRGWHMTARGDGSQGLPDRAADTSSDRWNELWTTVPRETVDPSWLLRSVARLSFSVRCA